MLSTRLPVSSRPEFVALPSDPDVPLTPEQSAALWGGDFNILARMIIDGYRASLAPSSEWIGGAATTPAADLMPLAADDHRQRVARHAPHSTAPSSAVRERVTNGT